MSQFFLPHSLVESYGGRFPSASEQDHLMALRGMLVRWVKRVKSVSLYAHDEISNAIKWVEAQIAKECGQEYMKLPNVSEALLDHYEDSVSWNLGWLHLLSINVPPRTAGN